MLIVVDIVYIPRRASLVAPLPRSFASPPLIRSPLPRFRISQFFPNPQNLLDLPRARLNPPNNPIPNGFDIIRDVLLPRSLERYFRTNDANENLYAGGDGIDEVRLPFD